MARSLSVCVRTRLAPSLWNTVTLHRECIRNQLILLKRLGTAPSPGTSISHSTASARLLAQVLIITTEEVRSAHVREQLSL